MDSNWRDKKLYPAIGIIFVLGFIYLNYFDNSYFSFPIITWSPPKMGFVGVNGTRFGLVDNGNIESPVYLNGWNSYWLMEESVWGPSRYRVSDMLKKGAEMGMTVCRTWAFSDGARPNDLQTQPGVFNERVFKGLDYVVYEARKHGIRLILCLVNNLNAFGGKAQYLRWAEEAGVNITSSTDSFFSNPIMKEYYKSYVKAILGRKNSFTGVKYSEEPAIFAWELMNEPRCKSNSSAPALQAWITEMAAFVKNLDGKHLVTVGLEGFYSLNSTGNYGANPGEWAASLGSDFIKNSAIENIDFASVHAYPHSWLVMLFAHYDFAPMRKFGYRFFGLVVRIPDADLEAKAKYLSNWVDAHINDSENVLKKPVLFTEVGTLLATKTGGIYDRDILLRMVYDQIYESAKKREAGAGVLIWQLLVEGVEEYSDKYSFVAWKYPSTYKLILEQSCRLRNTTTQSLKNRKDHHKDPCFSQKTG